MWFNISNGRCCQITEGGGESEELRFLHPHSMRSRLLGSALEPLGPSWEGEAPRECHLDLEQTIKAYSLMRISSYLKPNHLPWQWRGVVLNKDLGK